MKSHFPLVFVLAVSTFAATPATTPEPQPSVDSQPELTDQNREELRDMLEHSDPGRADRKPAVLPPQETKVMYMDFESESDRLQLQPAEPEQ